MKLPFVTVPDFKKQVEDERKPTFYGKLTPTEQDEYNRNLIAERTLLWSCSTAASAYNLGMVIILLLIVINGLQLLTIVQAIAAHFFGIKPP